MVRKAIRKETYRTLFARTGNKCAFPGCTHELVGEDDEFVAEICHIEAANPGGERFNSEMTDNQRRAPSNLIVLCHKHHVKTNNEAIYTVNALKKMKAEHEARCAGHGYNVPERVILEIQKKKPSFGDRSPLTIRGFEINWM